MLRERKWKRPLPLRCIRTHPQRREFMCSCVFTVEREQILKFACSSTHAPILLRFTRARFYTSRHVAVFPWGNGILGQGRGYGWWGNHRILCW
jgi:hypothetical protein